MSKISEVLEKFESLGVIEGSEDKSTDLDESSDPTIKKDEDKETEEDKLDE